ncbi:MAG: FadR/GntR family transcriptional regulator [Bacillota bacterium]|nr:FadR/GntR family transcriptional regulator [Bacillota bacterium]
MQIYNQILTEIQSGSFKIGDKLPAERELCENFGVSRVPIRQALSALELNGIIYSRQGEGVFVKSNQITSESSETAIFFKSISPEDIIEVRMNIEPLIIKFAAQTATDEDIENLNRTLQEMEEEVKTGVYIPETDEKLHICIAKASHNELLINIMAAISNAMKQQEMWKFIRDRTVTRSDYLEVNFKEHQLLVKAIQGHKQEEAVEIMNEHMNNLFDRYWKG